MKTFIFTIESKKTKIGSKFFAKVFVIENNTPIFIGGTNYNSGSYRGHKSEVFNLLCSLGEISPEIAKLTYQPNYFGGDEIAKHIQIFELS